MTKKFLTSVANAYLYKDSDGTLLAFGKTLLDSSIETTLGSTDVRGGYGNPLLYKYYHTSAMNITISDAQWNLAFLAETVGSSITSATVDVFKEESVTLSAPGVGTLVSGTAIYVPGATSNAIYGWATLADGTVVTATFSTAQAFTLAGSAGATSEVVCVRYYSADTAARSITINSNILPDTVHIVLEAQLNSSDTAGVNKIGTIQIDVPRATLSGAFSIKMTADGVASTPITASAIANEDVTTGACTNVPYYATIKEIISGANWYDSVIGIAIEGGDFTQTVATSGHAVRVWAIPAQPALPFLCPVAAGVTGYMWFTSGTPGTATISAGLGVVTGVTGGTTLLHAVITNKPTIEASALLTLT
jgi:hypothetical protein